MGSSHTHIANSYVLSDVTHISSESLQLGSASKQLQSVHLACTPPQEEASLPQLISLKLSSTHTLNSEQSTYI